MLQNFKTHNSHHCFTHLCTYKFNFLNEMFAKYYYKPPVVHAE